MNYPKRIFRKLTPLEMATIELVAAERAKLEAETGKEFAEAISGYNIARIARLKKYINTLSKEEAK